MSAFARAVAAVVAAECIQVAVGAAVVAVGDIVAAAGVEQDGVQVVEHEQPRGLPAAREQAEQRGVQAAEHSLNPP